MKSNLNSELIYDSYKNGKLDEEVASERLLAIIESDSDQDNRVKSIKILGKIGSKQYEIFKTMENLLVSDSNERVRGAAANMILDNFSEKGVEVIKMALQNEYSPFCLSVFLDSLKNVDRDYIHSFLTKELKKRIDEDPKVLQYYYYYYLYGDDTITVPRHIEELIDVYIMYKKLSFFKQNYGQNFLDYEIEDEEFVKIAIIGLDIKKISDIIGLEDLTELKYLDLRGNQIEEIDFMENFPKLERLRLEENQIKEIKGLDKLSNLTELRLRNNQITEIKGLNKLKSLIFLDLSENNISEIKGLDSLSSLKVLFLQDNLIIDIKGLENLKNLYELNLSGSKISKIKGLENLENLHDLNLGENQISKIEGFETLINLGTLCLYNNQIANLEGIENLKNLHFIDLRNNIISIEKENVLDKKKRPKILYSDQFLYDNF